MERTQDPVFHHGKFLVDSSGLDPTIRPKYDYILQEMAKADGISLFHRNLRDGTHDSALIVSPQCFDFAFQLTRKYFRTLIALMQADGIPFNKLARFLGEHCKSAGHKQFSDADIEWAANETGDVVPRAAQRAGSGDEWVDVGEELQSMHETMDQVSCQTGAASLDENQKLAYLRSVREICEKGRIECNIGEVFAETPQIGLLRAIWQEELPQVLQRYQSMKDSHDSIPLHSALLEAIKAQRLKLVDFFLDAGAKFTGPVGLPNCQVANTQDKGQTKPCTSQNCGMCAARTPARPEDPIIWSHQSPELYELLFRRDWREIRTNGAFLDECLKEACNGGRADVVQYLVRKGARPRKASWMADASTLLLAASSTEMLEYILFEGEREPADGLYDHKAIATTIQGTGAMQWAAAVNCDLDVVRALLRWGADVNDVASVDLVGDPRECENGPALHKVLNTMSWKFESCEDDGKRNKDMEKYFDMIAFLLENGADPNIKNQGGLDAWELAGKLGNAHKARLAEILKPDRPGKVDGGSKPEL